MSNQSPTANGADQQGEDEVGRAADESERQPSSQQRKQPVAAEPPTPDIERTDDPSKD